MRRTRGQDPATQRPHGSPREPCWQDRWRCDGWCRRPHVDGRPWQRGDLARFYRTEARRFRHMRQRAWGTACLIAVARTPGIWHAIQPAAVVGPPDPSVV